MLPTCACYAGVPKLPPPILIPPPSLGPELASLLEDGTGADVTFEVEGERMPAHKIILQARGPPRRAGVAVTRASCATAGPSIGVHPTTLGAPGLDCSGLRPCKRPPFLSRGEWSDP